MDEFGGVISASQRKKTGTDATCAKVVAAESRITPTAFSEAREKERVCVWEEERERGICTHPGNE